jgi:hypothetical protein
MDRPPKMSKKTPKRGQERERDDRRTCRRYTEDTQREEQEEKKQKTERQKAEHCQKFQTSILSPLHSAKEELKLRIESQVFIQANDSDWKSARCPVLPGGHAHHHEDAEGNPFSWTPYGGRINLEETPSSSSSSSTTSETSSEEMIADAPEGQGEKRKDAASPSKTGKAKKRKEKDYMVALEIKVNPEDAKYLASHPRKASIWLSTRMEAKSKEHSWKRR